MRIPRWLQIFGTLAILAVVVRHIPIQKLLDEAWTADLIWLLPAFAVTLMMLTARHMKWHRLLRAADLHISESDSLRSLLSGFALSVATPGRMGEFGRCLFLPRELRTRVFQLNILERVLDGWAVFTYAVISLMLVAFKPYGIFAFAVWLALLPCFMGLPAILAWLGNWKFLGASLRARLQAGSEGLGKISAPPFAAWSLLTTSLDILIFFLLMNAFHRTAFVTTLEVFPWITIAGGLPIAVGGIGPREGVAAFLLSRRAVPGAAAIDAALFLFLLSAVLPALAGGLWMLARKIQGDSRRELSRAITDT